MPNIINLPLETVRGMTRTQIMSAINAVFAPLTRRDLIVWLFDSTAVNEKQNVTYYDDGQVKLITDVVQDIETDARISSRKTQYTYFPTGEVRKIVIKNFDASNNELIGQGWEIEHLSPGAQPIKRVI